MYYLISDSFEYNPTALAIGLGLCTAAIVIYLLALIWLFWKG